MGLGTFFELMRRRSRAFATVAVLVVMGAIAYTALQVPMFRSSASVFFSLQNGGTASDLVQGSTYTQSQIASFATLTTTPEVLGPVVENLELDTTPAALARSVTATAALDTVIIDISVLDGSPDRAAEIANAVAEQLARTVEDLAPIDTQGEATIRATIVAPATVPDSSVTPNIPLNLAAGVLVGLLLGLAFAIVRESLDTRVRGVEQVRLVTQAPVLGSIAVLTSRDDRKLVVHDQPQSAQAEAYRQVRTNLQFLEVGDKPRSILVTSALPGEGKSTIAANLAIALAETSTRVLLIDADLRRPSIADTLGLEGAAGLTTVLIGRADFDDVVQEWGQENLHVLTAGEIPPNPSELLASPPMTRLLREVEHRYDTVLIDTAPLLPVADAAILSGMVMGTIVVVNCRKVRRLNLADALLSLEQVQSRVLGVVLNRAERPTEQYGYAAHARTATPNRHPVPTPSAPVAGGDSSSMADLASSVGVSERVVDHGSAVLSPRDDESSQDASRPAALVTHPRPRPRPHA